MEDMREEKPILNIDEKELALSSLCIAVASFIAPMIEKILLLLVDVQWIKPDAFDNQKYFFYFLSCFLIATFLRIYMKSKIAKPKVFFRDQYMEFPKMGRPSFVTVVSENNQRERLFTSLIESFAEWIRNKNKVALYDTFQRSVTLWPERPEAFDFIMRFYWHTRPTIEFQFSKDYRRIFFREMDSGENAKFKEEVVHTFFTVPYRSLLFTSWESIVWTIKHLFVVTFKKGS